MTIEPMKTKHIKITNRTVRELRCILAAFLTWLLPALILFVATNPALPLARPGWEVVSWAPKGIGMHTLVSSSRTATGKAMTPPNGSADTATFEASSFTNVLPLSQYGGQRHRVSAARGGERERVHDQRRHQFDIDHQRRWHHEHFRAHTGLSKPRWRFFWIHSIH